MKVPSEGADGGGGPPPRGSKTRAPGGPQSSWFFPGKGSGLGFFLAGRLFEPYPWTFVSAGAVDFRYVKYEVFGRSIFDKILGRDGAGFLKKNDVFLCVSEAIKIGVEI